MSMLRLLAGPDLMSGPEPLAEHGRRLGPLPPHVDNLIETLVRSGLSGRGGASFPVGLKWRSIACRSRRSAVVVVNGAEGEPHSRKDRLLMSVRPHLVIDGAFLAARTLKARQIIFYIGEEHVAARTAMVRALAARPETEALSARWYPACPQTRRGTLPGAGRPA